MVDVVRDLLYLPRPLWSADMIKEVAQGPCLQVPEIQECSKVIKFSLISSIQAIFLSIFPTVPDTTQST